MRLPWASAMWTSTVYSMPVRRTSPCRTRQQVKTELETLGLEARNYVLHSPHNPACCSRTELESSIEYLREGIDLCLYWGINQLMLNPGQWVYGVPRQQAWENAVRFIRNVCEYAAAREIFIALEAEPYVWFLVNDIPSTVAYVS